MFSVCPICEDRSDKNSYFVREMYYGTRREFEYKECRNCGVLYLGQQLEGMQQFYPENYHGHVVANLSYGASRRWACLRDRAGIIGKPFLGNLLCLLRPPQQLLHTLGKAKLSLDSKILDIGCGAGNLLHQLKAIGFKHLEGVDPFLPEALSVRENGFVIAKKTLEETEGLFDFVMLNHSLEHIADHKKTLLEIRRLLSPSGICMVRMPIVGGTAWKIYKTYWYQLDAPRHLMIHSEQSLRRLTSSTGFRILETVYDSEDVQFVRSELYQKNISTKDFLETYDGDPSKIFSAQQLTRWKNMTTEANQSRLGDQAAFFLKLN